MTSNEHAPFHPGMVLAWSDKVRQSDTFKNYVALVGEGPFADFEVISISPKSTVYGDERFRDGMKVPEKLLNEAARLNEARQIGDLQRIRIHALDAEKHLISAEFPAYFFAEVKK